MSGKLYNVRVRADYRWAHANVGGRKFSKHGFTVLNEADVNDEIRNSPLLEVTELEVEQEQEQERELEEEQKAKPTRRRRRKSTAGKEGGDGET